MRFIFHYPETGGADSDILDAGPLGEVAVAVEGDSTRWAWISTSATPCSTKRSTYSRCIGRGSGTNCAVFPSSQLSAYLTGTTLHPDGGTSASAGWFNWPDQGWAGLTPVSGRRGRCSAGLGAAAGMIAGEGGQCAEGLQEYRTLPGGQVLQ